MKDIDVAIAIVTYKSADFTIDCLRSIAAEQAIAPRLKIRAIVVDNVSGDAAIVAHATEKNGWGAWVTVIEAPRNGGFAYANNVAIQRAYADGPPAYFHILNPDTIVKPGAIATLIDFLEARPEVGIAGSNFDVDPERVAWPYAFRFPSVLSELETRLGFGLATRLLDRWVLQKEMGSTPELIDWGGGASMMVRREVFDAIGGLDEQYFLYFEETDLCLRAKKAGFPTWYVPESVIWHIGQQSTQAAKDGQIPRRLPGYWFESRRHYFMANHGLAYAIVADLVAAAAHELGGLKRIFRRRGHMGVPHFVGDLIRHSVLWPKNRGPAALRKVPRFVGGEPQAAAGRTSSQPIAGPLPSLESR